MLRDEGWIYLLQSPTKFWKIGYTNDPLDRLKTFNVKLPFEVNYAHLIMCYNMRKLEKELHQAFAHRRGNGEWFELSDSDVRWIKQFTHQIDFDATVDDEYHQLMRRATKVVDDKAFRRTLINGVLWRVIALMACVFCLGSLMVIRVTQPNPIDFQFVKYTVIYGLATLVFAASLYDFLSRITKPADHTYPVDVADPMRSMSSANVEQ